jgi:hypothetical protein
VSAYLDIIGALLWITAAIVEMAVRRHEMRQLRRLMLDRARHGADGGRGE